MTKQLAAIRAKYLGFFTSTSDSRGRWARDQETGKAGGGEEQNKNSCFELNSVLKKEKEKKNSAGEIQVKIAAVLNFKSR